MSIRFKPITPRSFNGSAIYDQFREAARTIGRQLDNDFARTYATWEDGELPARDGENKIPEFTTLINSDGSETSVNVSTDNLLYFFLNDGTAVRYATMQLPGFEAKTQPNRLDSGAGALPDPLYVSKGVPRDGIEPRNWNHLIARRRRQFVENTWRRAMSRGIGQSGHRYR